MEWVFYVSSDNRRMQQYILSPVTKVLASIDCRRQVPEKAQTLCDKYYINVQVIHIQGDNSCVAALYSESPRNSEYV